MAGAPAREARATPIVRQPSPVPDPTLPSAVRRDLSAVHDDERELSVSCIALLSVPSICADQEAFLGLEV